MDNTDNVEGILAEKSGVWRHAADPSGSSSNSSADSILCGAPYRISSSINASKEQMLVQVCGSLGCLLSVDLDPASALWLVVA